MKKIFFIANPTTRRYYQFKKDKLPEILPQNEYDIRIEETKYAGHEQELAKEAVENNYDIVVAIGGDGTIHKIIQELTFTPTALCIAPTTPGSSFAHYAGIPTNPMKAIALIRENNIRFFDVGRVNNVRTGEQKFLGYFGLNYSGKLAELIAPHQNKNLLHYYMCAIKAFWRKTSNKVKVNFTYHEKEISVFEFLIANIDQYGCKIKVFPYSNAQDGIFEILELKKISFLRYLQVIFLFYFNYPQNIGDVTEYYKTEKINLFFEKETCVQMDCEPYVMVGETQIDMITKSIKIVVPKSFSEPVKL